MTARAGKASLRELVECFKTIPCLCGAPRGIGRTREYDATCLRGACSLAGRCGQSCRQRIDLSDRL